MLFITWPCLYLTFEGADMHETLLMCAACITTKASPPVAPEAPYVSVPAAANSLQLEWPEPWGCGAPVTGYLVDMARADTVLTVQGPPTPPQVQPCMHFQARPCSRPPETVWQGVLSSLSLPPAATGYSSTVSSHGCMQSSARISHSAA